MWVYVSRAIRITILSKPNLFFIFIWKDLTCTQSLFRQVQSKQKHESWIELFMSCNNFSIYIYLFIMLRGFSYSLAKLLDAYGFTNRFEDDEMLYYHYVSQIKQARNRILYTQNHRPVQPFVLLSILRPPIGPKT